MIERSNPPDITSGNAGRPDPGRVDADRLANLVHAVLREQPARRAPPSLEARVLAEITRREALPWWRTSFLHWPLPMRVLFLLVSLGFVKLTLSVFSWLIADAPVSQAISNAVASTRSTTSALATLADLFMAAIHAIPPLWLHAGLALVALSYLTLFALSAFGYRMLYLNK